MGQKPKSKEKPCKHKCGKMFKERASSSARKLHYMSCPENPNNKEPVEETGLTGTEKKEEEPMADDTQNKTETHDCPYAGCNGKVNEGNVACVTCGRPLEW